MSDDERVLRSFVVEDEELQDLYSVTAAKHSKGQLPPVGGEETVAVTDERLLWFNNELAEVSLAAVEAAELEYVERRAAPPVVLGGGLVLVLGIFASIGAFLTGVESLLVVAMPAMTGLAVFLGTRVFASVTDREGETRAGHRLRLQTDDGPVSLWGDDEQTMERLQAVVRGEEPPVGVDGEDVGDESEDPVDTEDDEGTVTEETDAPLQSTATAEPDVDAGSELRNEDDESAE